MTVIIAYYHLNSFYFFKDSAQAAITLYIWCHPFSADDWDGKPALMRDI